MLKPKLYAAFVVIAVTLCFLCASPFSRAQAPLTQPELIALHLQGYVEVPDSSVVRPEDAGKRAHTNVLIWRDSTPRVPSPQVLNSQPSSTWETPASIACVYNIVTQVSGCPIASTTALPTGGSGAIAIVDAYDDPDAASDLATFSSYFKLPAATFQVKYASGTRPPQDPAGNGGWELEESLDIEWAHAMAPSAAIYLVEAASNSTSDLLTAEQVAASLVSAAGGGVVSNSWGGGEFPSETNYDSKFLATNVAFSASTGDCAFCVEWPSVSPNIAAVGGTSILRNQSTGDFIGESYWDDSSGGGGGGLSQYESRPSFQNTVESIVGSRRGVPDLSSDADPVSGVAVYDSFPYCSPAPCTPVSEGWLPVGGTSVGAPTIAGRADATAILSSTAPLQNYNYGELAAGTAYPSNFRDITSGASECVTGWDFCSGIGSPLGPLGSATTPQAAAPTNSSSYTIYGGTCPTIEFYETLYDSTPGAQIYWQLSGNSGNSTGQDPLDSGGTFNLEYQSCTNNGPSGTMYATAPGYSQSATVPIYF